MMINTNKIAGRMREMRKTQRAVAARLGIAPSTLSQKLNGIRPMMLDEAEKLAEILEIKKSEFGDFFFCSEVA